MVGPSASRREVAGWTMGVLVSTLLWGALIAGVIALRS
jgi:hypothetical protein